MKMATHHKVTLLIILIFANIYLFHEIKLPGQSIADTNIPARITDVILVNADTGQEVMPIIDGLVITPSDLPTTHLNILASTYGSVGSVVFILDTIRTVENNAPYTIGGDYGVGKYKPWTLPPGEHTLVVTPYSAKNGTGTTGTAETFSFTVSHGGTPPPPPPQIGPPKNFSGTALSTSSIRLSWTGTMPGSLFHVYRDNVSIGNTNNETYTDTGLSANTEYSYFIESDVNGAIAATDPVNVSTLADVVPVVIGEKIQITPDMVANGVTNGNHLALFDGDTNTAWTVSWDALRHYQVAVIDLGRTYSLSKLRYYKQAYWGTQVGTITARTCRVKTWAEAQAEISKNNPLKCTDAFTDALSGSTPGWVEKPINVSTRYLEVQLGGSKTLVGEFEAYGTTTDGTHPLFDAGATSVSRTFPLMNDFIGVNAFNNNPADQLATVAGHERDYVDISWLNGGDYDPTTNPGTLHAVGAHEQIWCNAGFLCNDAMKFEGASGFFFDTKYAGFKNAGLKVFPAIKQCLRGGFASSRENLCVPAYDNTIPGYNNTPANTSTGEEDPFNPYSYRAVAELFFQVAARYGNHVVADNLLKLRAGQPRLSGLGYIDAIEAGNEEDKTWQDVKAWHSPYMEAARMSAIYDGHMGTIVAPGSSVPNVGVKQADPNLPVSIGALSQVGTASDNDFLAESRLNLIRLWSSVYRNGSMPLNIINVHHYTRKKLADGTQTGSSPEEGDLRNFADSLVSYAKTHWNGAPVWITEFGYDTGANGASKQGALAYGPFSVQEVQGMWDVRSFLELAPTRVQRATLYMFPDSCTSADCSAANGLYSTSGLVGSIPGNFLPKKVSYYYVATLKSVLSNTRFSRDLSSSGVKNYEFKNDAGTKTVNVIWSGTANNTTVLYNAGVAGTLVQLSNTSTTGISSAFAGGNLTITEKPVFILR